MTPRPGIDQDRLSICPGDETNNPPVARCPLPIARLSRRTHGATSCSHQTFPPLHLHAGWGSHARKDFWNKPRCVNCTLQGMFGERDVLTNQKPRHHLSFWSLWCWEPRQDTPISPLIENAFAQVSQRGNTPALPSHCEWMMIVRYFRTTTLASLHRPARPICPWFSSP